MTASPRRHHSVLLVSKRVNSDKLDWADLAISSSQALQMWRQRNYEIIFADFGSLGKGMTGARLASAFRFQSPHVKIVLLTDQLHEHQQVWAQQHGADLVIERTAKAIAAQMPYAGRIPRDSDFKTSEYPGEQNESLSAVVNDHLSQPSRFAPSRIGSLAEQHAKEKRSLQQVMQRLRSR